MSHIVIGAIGHDYVIFQLRDSIFFAMGDTDMVDKWFSAG